MINSRAVRTMNSDVYIKEALKYLFIFGIP